MGGLGKIPCHPGHPPAPRSPPHLLLPQHPLSAWKSICSRKGKYLLCFKNWKGFFWSGLIPESLEDELLPPNSKMRNHFKIAQVWGAKTSYPEINDHPLKNTLKRIVAEVGVELSQADHKHPPFKWFESPGCHNWKKKGSQEPRLWHTNSRPTQSGESY